MMVDGTEPEAPARCGAAAPRHWSLAEVVKDTRSSCAYGFFAPVPVGTGLHPVLRRPPNQPHTSTKPHVRPHSPRAQHIAKCHNGEKRCRATAVQSSATAPGRIRSGGAPATLLPQTGMSALPFLALPGKILLKNKTLTDCSAEKRGGMRLVPVH